MHLCYLCIIDFYGKERDTYISTCKWSKYSNSQATSPADLFVIKEKLRTHPYRCLLEHQDYRYCH